MDRPADLRARANRYRTRPHSGPIVAAPSSATGGEHWDKSIGSALSRSELAGGTDRPSQLYEKRVTRFVPTRSYVPNSDDSCVSAPDLLFYNGSRLHPDGREYVIRLLGQVTPAPW